MKLLPIILIGGYLWGIWSFWRGFRSTNFNPNLPNKLRLSLLWPVLVVTNTSYRQNFQKAIKSSSK